MKALIWLLAPLGFMLALPQEVWLEVTTPDVEQRLAGTIPWYEVRGWAGVDNALAHDVFVLIDVSGSTAIASGVDVDGDGEVGRRELQRTTWLRLAPRRLSSDPGDTVLAAELTAMRRLLEMLDPARTRIGILSFASAARVRAPMGSDPHAIRKALQSLDGAYGAGATNLTRATRRATRDLLAARNGDQDSVQQSILILSDGYPTHPDAALAAAREAADAGIRIFSFALGGVELDRDDVFVEMARVSGGKYLRLVRPGDILLSLPRVNLAKLAAVEIHNESSDAPARALRVFPDGSFDGFVPLVDGVNRIRVTARGDEGGETTEYRTVRFENRPPRDVAEARDFEAHGRAVREALRARTLETQLAVQQRAAREAQALERQIEVEIEAVPDAP